MVQAGQASEVTVLIRTLSDRIVEVLEQLSTLTDAELDAAVRASLRHGGTVRSLLTHNIDHERMHVGQVYNIRYEAKMMQNAEVARLLAEWLRDRALLISSLYGLSDEDLDRRHARGRIQHPRDYRARALLGEGLGRWPAGGAGAAARRANDAVPSARRSRLVIRRRQLGWER